MIVSHRAGIVNNVLHVARGVHHGGVIGACTCELGEPRDDQRETLAVGDVPMELAHLNGFQHQNKVSNRYATP